MKILAAFIFMSLAVLSFSQEILLEEDVAGDTIIEKNGPNLKRYGHFFFDYGFFADQPEGDGMEIQYGFSNALTFGYRYKYKLNNTFAFGWDMHLSSWIFRIKQNDQKTFPDSILHTKERLTAGNLGGEIYLRINYGRRGNQIGNFIDLAGYGNWIYGATHYTKDKLDNPNSVHAKIVETSYTNLGYIDQYAYGVNCRLGFNRFVLGASYRLSDIILETYNTYPEMPRLSVSLQIGIH